MGGTPGYAVGQFRDDAEEIRRLQAQAKFVAQAEEAAFRELGFPERGTVLDVGCGPGTVAARFAATRPALSTVGVDRDPRVLSEARAHIRALQSDATALPFDEGTFDAAYARVVLRHLPDPQAAAIELARIVRPGGRVLLGDTDDGTLVLDPEPEGFAEVLAARHATFRRRGADPHMGRRLPGLLWGAGLTEVDARPVPITSAAIGADAFAAILLMPLADAVDPDVLSPARVQAVADNVRNWGRRSDVFAMTTAVVAGASRCR